MVVFPNCKINLGLHILRKRTDGYHDLETVFYPIGFSDMLEIVPSDSLKFTSTGLAIDGNSEDNLCLKAFHLLKEKCPELPPIHIHLHKIVPMGAGLGGGSADAAFVLTLLNTMYKLELSFQTLEEIASNLGSDCTFFVRNSPSIATGRGTDLSPIEVTLKGKYIVVIYPKIHVSTKVAYSKVVPKERTESLTEIVSLPIERWKEVLENDFEKSVFAEFPEIAAIKEEFYKQGAIYSSLSGSGSAVFGIFDKETTIITNLAYTVWESKL